MTTAAPQLHRGGSPATQSGADVAAARSLLADPGWTGGQYSLFRAIFGLYLFVHLATLAPWAAELFSNQGVLPDASASPLARAFPNVLSVYDPPWFATTFVGAGAVLAILFAVGWRDRLAAIGLWYVWACCFGRNPLTSNPGLPYVGLMLLAHALIPPAPYGSLAARGRADPGGGWRMPISVWSVVWVLMAVGYTYSGATKLASPSWLDGSAVRHVLDNPLARPTVLREWLLALPPVAFAVMTWGALALELLFAPLALVRVLRPWLWLAGLSMHLGLMVLVDFADLSLGMVMLHLFTFNPAWVRPALARARAAPLRAAAGVNPSVGAPTSTPAAHEPEAPETLFYDGHCGFCHAAVRFVLSEDRGGAFRFAPLGGDAFARAVNATQRATLPDTVVLRTSDGQLLVRSRAVLHILARLGGAWRVIGGALRVIPRPILDRLYDAIARVRRRLLRAPTDACPVVTPDLRSRFDL